MRFTHLLVPLALAGTLLTGCGGDQADNAGPGGTSNSSTGNGVAALEPAAALDKSLQALKAAGSFSLKGEFTEDGERLDLDVKISGDDVFGSIGLSAGRVELLRVADTMWMRPDQEFWKSNAGDDAGEALVELVGDRWVVVSEEDDDFKSFLQITDPTQLFDSGEQLTRGDTKQIDGVEAIGLKDPGEDGGTLYIATTGEPYPLLVEEGPPGNGTITFGDFGAEFDEIKAPAKGDIVDLDKLQES